MIRLLTATKLSAVALSSPGMVLNGTNARSAAPSPSGSGRSLARRAWVRWLSSQGAGVALGVALCASSSDAGADIYRYVDKDGVIHFSNVNRRGKRVTRDKARKRSGSAKSTGAGSVVRSKAPDEYDAYIREAAALYQIPEALVRAVIRVESNFDPRAISRANAQGLMQLIPATAERMLVRDPFDARQNVLGGTRYLRVLANLFNGNLQLTLAAYNAGEGAVIRYNGIPPYEETQAYVRKVLEYYSLYRSQGQT